VKPIIQRLRGQCSARGIDASGLVSVFPLSVAKELLGEKGEEPPFTGDLLSFISLSDLPDLCGLIGCDAEWLVFGKEPKS